MDTRQYINDVIDRGDEGSDLLNAKCAPTLQNGDLVDIIETGSDSFPVLRIPKGYDVVVCSAAGDDVKDMRKHTISMVRSLEQYMKNVGAEPVGMANVVDSETADLGLISLIGETLADGCNDIDVPNLNGENARLGHLVNMDANVMGTMIGIVKSGKLPPRFVRDHVNYSVFTPENAVWINSDGIGTKSELHVRAGRIVSGLYDWIAMLVDDTIKKGAIPRVASGIFEQRGRLQMDAVYKRAEHMSGELGFDVMFDPVRVARRIMGYSQTAPAYNLSGSVVSEIDEEWLRDPPVPNLGEYLIAVTAPIPNPRSNGITVKRETMEQMMGSEWHKTKEGKIFLEYLSQPSTILFPLFQGLLNEGIASSVYHMSGGAFKSKLAKPLAAHDCYCQIVQMFPPDWREASILGWNFTSAEEAYQTSPMGNDGFFTTTEREKAVEFVKSHGLKPMISGKLEPGRGIELPVKDRGGDPVRYFDK